MSGWLQNIKEVMLRPAGCTHRQLFGLRSYKIYLDGRPRSKYTHDRM